MPEGETLPKGKSSKEWLEYADKKANEFKEYHSWRDMFYRVKNPHSWRDMFDRFGRVKNPQPLSDDYSKLLSRNELEARKVGMDFLRKERQEENASKMAEYRKGGRAKESGPAKLHKGEAVVRKSPRKKARLKGR